VTREGNLATRRSVGPLRRGHSFAGRRLARYQAAKPDLTPLGCVVVMGVDDRLLHNRSSLCWRQTGHVVGPAIGGVGLLDAMAIVGKSRR
jgi:hypothetical protein